MRFVDLRRGHGPSNRFGVGWRVFRVNTFRPEFENPLPRVSKTVRALPSEKFYPHRSVRGFGGGLKRGLDVCIAVTAFGCLAPLLALIAALVGLNDGGAIFYLLELGSPDCPR